MQTGHGTPPSDPTALFHDIVSTLRETRSGVHQHRMAQTLLQKDASGSRLVALIDDAERAVFFNPASRTLEAVPFDRDGTHESDAKSLSQRLSDPTAWVETHAASLEWVHPHYRWACGMSREDE
ncbi:hypothetical protein E6P09_04825 [Haloferax mediterranei ATCC 33500]|uniref:Uncharacterized protein n=1 Tax=Haloferax mediterranei (strain ATCC 33500 / DSM 1411 / JCM 8866 / NBRC 14739 / NCIMB 2177 / R-4) TaxID=523841 RepID=I3R1H5_HALMT|nr:hypothetical protein [Haloferax mediterranei]AFK18085.1 hypothetical protein HFX_0349 [Haloferax mediterranei ATCC 33500]AHZ22504.1 hypothetical protein BM92_07510 [Haloferax mediterranei ATCC 33500]EMA02641.1 hypothetical protein C439_08660 [Haloferax mediterranei ATCC 33500]MDX5988176.1 hypothetical protein [Haloferax mediterranei ATCC 33500]QCQ74621.1 hypothetical protein E6P09_04825 [Haloferax mediterranei ATCC 33500]